MPHPIQEASTPVFHSLVVGRRPRPRTRQEPDCIDKSVQVPCLDEARSAAGVYAGDALGELQVRIHARWRSQKPRTQQLRRMCRRARFVTKEMERQGQRVGRRDQLAEVPVILYPLNLRIGLAVPANVWQSIWLGWIRPPIRRQA